MLIRVEFSERGSYFFNLPLSPLLSVISFPSRSLSLSPTAALSPSLSLSLCDHRFIYNSAYGSGASRQAPFGARPTHGAVQDTQEAGQAAVAT